MTAKTAKDTSIQIQNEQYAETIRKYRMLFGELPPTLYHSRRSLPLFIQLMEQAIAGKRGRVSEADLGYPKGSDL